MENPDLPQDILLEIFSRIPTKSVGKCRTLSKSWKTHLSTPNFIKKHLLTRKQTIQPENLAFTTQLNSLCIITSPTKSDEGFNNKTGSDKWNRVFGSCNGLILVNGLQGLVLMNPITLKEVSIPRGLQRNDLGNSVCGLGYDSCNDDYKIVKIWSYMSKNVDDWLHNVDVYSVKNGVWKTLDDGCFPFSPQIYAYEGGVFVNGVLHWLFCTCTKGGYRSCIAAFDLVTEVFSEMPLPKEFVRYPVSRTRIKMCRTNEASVVGGCLSIVDDNLSNGVTQVWIMKEYGVGETWVMFRIQIMNMNWHSIAAVLCYVEDGELLFLTIYNGLFACDLKSGTMRRVVLETCNYGFTHGIAFVDSLVSPE